MSIIIGSPINLVVRAKHNEGKPVYFMPFAKFGVSPLGQGLIATDQTIAQKSDILARFVRATVHGFKDVMKKDNYDAAVENGLKLSGTTEKQRESIKLQLLESVSRFHTDNTEGKPFGWMSDKDWDKSIDILLKTKKIDKPFPASNLYTNKFVPQH